MKLVDSNGTIITDAEFRARSPLTSFPAVLQAIDVEPYGYTPLQEVPAPEPSSFYTVIEGAPTQVDGVWTQTWERTPIPIEQAQAQQIALLKVAYQVAIVAPVSFTTAAGTTATFGQDAVDKSNLQEAIVASQPAGTWPINLWLDVTGNPVTPFTFADLQGLAAAMEAVDAPSFQHLLLLISQVMAAETIDAVQAVVWS